MEKVQSYLIETVIMKSSKHACSIQVFLLLNASIQMVITSTLTRFKAGTKVKSCSCSTSMMPLREALQKCFRVESKLLAILDSSNSAPLTEFGKFFSPLLQFP